MYDSILKSAIASTNNRHSIVD